MGSSVSLNVETAPHSLQEHQLRLLSAVKVLLGISLLFAGIGIGCGLYYYLKVKPELSSLKNEATTQIQKSNNLTTQLTRYCDELAATQFQVGHDPAAAIATIEECEAALPPDATLLGYEAQIRLSLYAQSHNDSDLEATLKSANSSLRIAPSPYIYETIGLAYCLQGGAGQAEQAFATEFKLLPSRERTLKDSSAFKTDCGADVRAALYP